MHGLHARIFFEFSRVLIGGNGPSKFLVRFFVGRVLSEVRPRNFGKW